MGISLLSQMTMHKIPNEVYFVSDMYFACLVATPPPDHLLQHTDQSKQQQMMNMYSNITTTSSSSMPNLAQQVPGVNYPRYLSNNTPSPLDDSMVRM